MAKLEKGKFTVVDGGKEGGDAGISRIDRAIFSGGGGGGGDMNDSASKDYVDARLEAAAARTEAKFIELSAQIRALNPATWWQVAFMMLSAVAVVFGILAYASDRFDGGLAASGIVEKVIQDQLVRDAAQDDKLDRILQKLDALDAPSPSNP